MSIALDTVSMLIDSAAHLWVRLEQVSPLATRPQRSAFDQWLAATPAGMGLAAAEAQQVLRDYRRLCSLLDELEALLPEGASAFAAIQARIIASRA